MAKVSMTAADAISLAQSERAARKQAQPGKPVGTRTVTAQPAGSGQAQLQRALDALAQSGVSGDALKAAARALAREYVEKLVGVQSIQVEADQDNPGYNLLTTVTRIPVVDGIPPQGPQGGKPSLFNTTAHVVHAGKTFTFQQGCFLYVSKGGKEPSPMATI